MSFMFEKNISFNMNCMGKQMVMDNEPELYVAAPFKNKKTHVVGGSTTSSLCGVSVGQVNMVTLSRLNVDDIDQKDGLCKRCKTKSTQLYLDWVKKLTVDDLELLRQ